MTVKDLIDKLQQFDLEDEVIISFDNELDGIRFLDIVNLKNTQLGWTRGVEIKVYE